MSFILSTAYFLTYLFIGKISSLYTPSTAIYINISHKHEKVIVIARVSIDVTFMNVDIDTNIVIDTDILRYVPIVIVINIVIVIAIDIVLDD